MGVQGLWQLLHPAGKPVSPAALEGKVLAVDVSIWLHQTLKGMRDKDGNPLPNAHLQGLFTRVCKLLFFRIRPVFVFDGGVPTLKKQTLAARRERKEKVDKDGGRTTQKLLENILRIHAVSGALGDNTVHINFSSSNSKKRNEPDIYQLPPLPEVDKGSADPLENAAAWEAELEREESHGLRPHLDVYRSLQDHLQNLDDIDFESTEFESLPPEIKHEILIEMKEQRKEKALAHFIDMPEESEDFSSFQLKKLIKQSKLSSRIESLRKEINERSSGDISYALGDDYYGEVVEARRVVSEDASHYILIKGLTRKQQMAEAERCKAENAMDEEWSEDEKRTDQKVTKSASWKRVKFENDETDSPGEDTFGCDIGDGFDDENCSVDRKMAAGIFSSDEDETKTRRRRRGKGLLKKNSSGNGRRGDNKAAKNSKGKHRPHIKRIVISDEDSNDFLKEMKPAVVQSKNQGATQRTEVDTPDIVNSSAVNSVMSLENIKQEPASIDSSPETCVKEIDLEIAREDDDFDDTRQKLISEEEELNKERESKMAVLMKSLEKRQELTSKVSSVTDGDIQEERISTEREKLLMEEENLAKEKESKMAALTQSLEKRTKSQSVQQSLHLSDKVTNDSETDEENECMDTPQTKTGFLEGVAKIEKKIVKKKSKAKHKGEMASVETNATAGSKAAPELTLAYLEDVDSFGVDQSDSGSHSLLTKTADDPKSRKVAFDLTKEDKLTVISKNGAEKSEPHKVTSRKRKKGEENVEADAKHAQRAKKGQSSPQTVRHTAGEQEEETLAKKKVRGKDTPPEPAQVAQETDVSEDEGFIEITVDPTKIQDDDLFPASIFTTEPQPSLDSPQQEDRNIPEESSDFEDEARVVEEDTVVRESLDSLKRGTETTDTVADDEMPVESEGEHTESERGAYMLHSGGEEGKEKFQKHVDSLADLYSMQRDLVNERKVLNAERGKQARLGKSITEQISLEAQELLQLFGIPYIVSPTEAESQCAFLEMAGLTQGTITDDSDAWLFGAQNVYKNFFNQSRYVEFYTAKAVQQRFGLDRKKLINVALLCGSDYTPGIPGVGPVRALEIMAEFPEEGLEGLQAFREWWACARAGLGTRGEGKIRNKLRDLELHEGFPSRQVVDSYLHPTVDESEEMFSWGTPDVDLLRQYAKDKFGWTKEKADEVLLPMMKEFTKTMKQGRIDSYFHPENFLQPKPVQSKRLQRALDKFQGKNGSFSSGSASESESTSDPEPDGSNSKMDLPEPGEGVIAKANRILAESGRKKGGGRTQRGKKSDRGGKCDVEKLKTKSGDSGRGRGKGSASNQRGRGGGRSSAYGRGQKTVIVSSKIVLKDEVSLSESSSSDGDDDGDKHDSKTDKKKGKFVKAVAKTDNVSKTQMKSGEKSTVRSKTVKKMHRGAGDLLMMGELASRPTSKGQQKTVKPKAQPKAHSSGPSGVTANEAEAFKAALGGDLDLHTMTVDDLGSDFSEEEFGV